MKISAIFSAVSMDLTFTVDNLEKFSAKPGKVHFEVLIHILSYIRDNKTLSLIYLNICINPSKCTLPVFAENFANLCTEKLKSTLVDNR